MSGIWQKLMGWLPEVRRAREESAALRGEKAALEKELARYKTWVPPGHYYSPLHDVAEARAKEQELFGARPREFAAVDLNTEAQWAWLEKVERAYASVPWGEQARPPLRYHYGLNQYHYMDAITYWGMLNALRPRKVIEVGVGHSSLVLLDARERLFTGALEVQFIDPHPELLKSLISADEYAALGVEERRLQDVPLSVFEGLEADDVLFVDSTHVSKAGSDVNFLFFEVLPRLRAGVVVHLHDIFYPFEYPAENIFYGIAWQELYLLRAFLEFNSAYEVLLWPHYLVELDRGRFEAKMPLTLKNTGGSMWLRRK